MPGLGRRQRRVLADMDYFGDGQWPKYWAIHADTRRVMESLHRLGLVTSVGLYCALTKEGEKIAKEMNCGLPGRPRPVWT